MERTIVPKSSSALYLLFAEGFCFLFISVAVLACGFVLNFHVDFDYDKVDEEHDYTQYWVGIVLLITAFLAVAAGTAQRTRWVVVTAMFLFLATILVSLFALVVEGNDWLAHKNAVRRKGFWESEDYECTSPTATSCVCRKAAASNDKTISTELNCKALERLDYLYGGLICCILAGVFLALSSLVIVLIFIPIRPLTVPVPKKRIRKITVLEEKEPKSVVAYQPKKRIVEPKPEVKEIVIREPKPQSTRMVVRPQTEPQSEVEEIVIRERKPQRPRTIVYEQPPPKKHIVYRAPQRQRTLVYDEPRPEEGSVRALVPVKVLPETERPYKEADYDVGRFVPKVHPTPAKPSSIIEEGFVVNPNFRKPTSTEEVQPEPVHYGREEMEPPVRYIRQEPAPVRYIHREEPEQGRYVRKPKVVYETRPRVVEERALVPVRRTGPRPQGRMVVHAEHPRQSYIIERPGHRPLIAIRRRRANSDEGPRLLRAREISRPPPKQRVYNAQPVHTYHASAPRVPWQRARSNSDEGPRLYRERPGRIYTDQEIAREYRDAEVREFSGGAAKPTVFTEENISTANLGHANAHTSRARDIRNYDWNLEANLPSADKWKSRPITPY